MIKETFHHTEHVKLFLSSFGDAPAEIATIGYRTDNLFSLLQMNKFVFNDITAISFDGDIRNCVGVAFLNPVEICHEGLISNEPIYALMIFTE